MVADVSEEPTIPATPDAAWVESTADYCTRWLATVSAAQRDKHDQVSPINPSLSLPQSRVPNTPPRVLLSCTPQRGAADHGQGDFVFPPTTPCRAPLHIAQAGSPAVHHDPETRFIEPPRIAHCETPKYEKRHRRKTRKDRYDTRLHHEGHRTEAARPRRERRGQERERLRSRREIMNNFSSSAVENGRVLVNTGHVQSCHDLQRLTRHLDETDLGDRCICERPGLFADTTYVSLFSFRVEIH